MNSKAVRRRYGLAYSRLFERMRELASDSGFEAYRKALSDFIPVSPGSP